MAPKGKIMKVKSILPDLLVLKSNTNSKYLRYVHDEDAKNQGFVAFSGGDARSPDAKFQLEAATGDGNDGLVHIRSSYNNKFWSRLDENSSWIVARADKPNENKQETSCTLFQPILVKHVDDENVVVRLLHVQLGAYATLFSEEPDYNACMKANSATQDPNSADVFTVTKWESLTILPRFVAFKSRSTGKYLYPDPRATSVPQFTCDDIGDQTVALEVIPENADGTVVRIKNRSSGSFLRIGCLPVEMLGDFEFAFFEPYSDNMAQFYRFSPVKIDSKTISLCSLHNNQFCKLDTSNLNFNGVECTNGFSATSPSLTKETYLVVEEPVLKRRVSVDFRFDDARIYGLRPLTMVTQTATNETSYPVTITISFSHTFTKTSTWENSISVTAGVETKLETGIPGIVKGEVTVSAEFNDTYKMGKSMTTEDTVNYQVQVEVPANQKVEVSLLARQGTCSVPFSYTQTDTYANGDKVSNNFYDGIYTGVSYFDFNSVTKPLVD